VRIQNYTQQRSPTRTTAAIREQRVISQDGPYADQDGVALVALFVYVST
jgi:hypothetical protein